NAVAALGRYRSAVALDALVELAASSSDPVVRMRALAALGCCHGLGNTKPLLERLGRVEGPAERGGPIEAPGGPAGQGGGAAPLALATTRDPDVLQALLSALVQLRPEAPAAASFARTIAKAARTNPEAYRARRPAAGPAPDNPDAPGARGEVIEQLALILTA